MATERPEVVVGQRQRTESSFRLCSLIGATQDPRLRGLGYGTPGPLRARVQRGAQIALTAAMVSGGRATAAHACHPLDIFALHRAPPNDDVPVRPSTLSPTLEPMSIADLHAYARDLRLDIGLVQTEINRRPIARYRAIVAVGWAGLGVATYPVYLHAVGLDGYSCLPARELQGQAFRYCAGFSAIAVVSSGLLIAGYTLVARQHRRRRPFILRYRALLSLEAQLRAEMAWREKTAN